MNAADAHLAQDPVMAGLIERFGGPLASDEDAEPRTDLYGALLRSITGQQLSVKAAAAIYGRLIARFGGHAQAGCRQRASMLDVLALPIAPRPLRPGRRASTRRGSAAEGRLGCAPPSLARP